MPLIIDSTFKYFVNRNILDKGPKTRVPIIFCDLVNNNTFGCPKKEKESPQSNVVGNRDLNSRALTFSPFFILIVSLRTNRNVFTAVKIVSPEYAYLLLKPLNTFKQLTFRPPVLSTTFKVVLN